MFCLHSLVASYSVRMFANNRTTRYVMMMVIMKKLVAILMALFRLVDVYTSAGSTTTATTTNVTTAASVNSRFFQICYLGASLITVVLIEDAYIIVIADVTATTSTANTIIAGLRSSQKRNTFILAFLQPPFYPHGICNRVSYVICRNILATLLLFTTANITTTIC